MDYNTAIVEASRMNMQSNMLQGLLGLAAILIIIGVVGSILSPRKTYRYRKVLSDLYVSGMIRELSQEDSIDLLVEEQLFKKWDKKQNSLSKELDNIIEDELMERVADKGLDKIEKKK